MPKPKLTPEIKLQADAIVARFNVERLRGQPGAHYVTNYRGVHLYLGRQHGDQFEPICRLTYAGDMNHWDFAIYKYSSGRYDPEEWFFPGAEEVDGAIEGAMRAGLKAYPS
ncbi:hypothetical protein [Candidatus Amarolinea aalborgensis]|uniref:hypothetical protein n=1 Tax=Candidatus Amarolinea aalborgensis TaxID=2249329 RepID=UPI003BFA0883